MKIFLTISFMLVCSFLSSAQRSGSNFFPIQNQNTPSPLLRNVIDTILPKSFIPANQGGLGCFTGIYFSDSGFVSGNNAYGDWEKAEFYDLSLMGYADTGAIQSVLVKFAYKTQNASPEDVVVKIYGVDTTGFEPFTLLGTSEPLNLSSISTNGGYAFFLFDTPVAVSDSFFVSVELPRAPGDTLVILSTADDCVENSGWSWEQWDNGTWHSILDSWIRDIDLAIFPVIDLPFNSGIESLDKNLQVNIYPNPATNFVVVHLSDDNPAPVSIRIINLEGRVVRQFYIPDKSLSNNSITLPLGRIDPSLYFCEVEKNKIIWRTILSVVE